jgi:predicted PhzF superfamily epimerase YddE/YHI9
MNYDTSLVFAFSSNDGASDKAHGNPALIIWDIPNYEHKKLITINARVTINGDKPTTLPIIDFIKVVDLEKLIFDIEYWLPDRQVSMCGHGTIGVVKAIFQRYNLPLKVEKTFTFNLNTKDFPVNRDNPQFIVKSDGITFKLETPDLAFPDAPLSSDDESYKLVKSFLGDNLFENTLYYTKMDDFVCVCKDAEKLRKLVIPQGDLQKLRKTLNRNYRIFVAVAPSKIMDYDYETTVFSDELPAPVFKDPACGSANKEIPQLLKITKEQTGLFIDKFKNPIVNFKMFYPYRFEEWGVKGGIQEVEYDIEKGLVLIKSFVSSVENGKVTINNKDISFEKLI